MIRRWREWVAAFAVLSTVVHAGDTTASADIAVGTLSTTRQIVPFEGTIERSDPTGDQFDLRVELPPGTWRGRAGHVEVSIRWTGFGDNLHLAVHRGDQLVASGTGIVATNQSVALPSAANGVYRVTVAFDPDSVSNAIAYEGVAEVEYAPRARPTRPLLPDLAVRPHPHVTFDSPWFDFFEPPPAPGESCYGSEADEQAAQLCLRFDQVIANDGDGPVELRFVIPHDETSPNQEVVQRLYWSDATAHYTDRPAGEWEFHPVHGHYHFHALTDSRLWAADERGERVGSAPVRTGRKVGYCVADILLDAWARKGNGVRTYHAPDCFFPASSDAKNDYLVQGISPGFADVYEWFVPDQYIEVSGLSDGTYILDTIADPENAIAESDEANNCGAVVVRLTAMSSATPAAEVLGPGPDC
jgi:hypothetical protein